MYLAYFDESGHPDDSRFVVVAGAIADVEQWSHFEREWLAELAPLGITVFHATDFEQGRGPFDRLTETEADELLLRLVGIICRRIEKSFSQAIDLKQYNPMNRKYVFAECYGHPYPCAARSSFARVEEWARNHEVPIQNVLWILEYGAKHRDQLEWIAKRDGIPDPDFKKKKDVVSLQCADLIAWSHHLYLTNSGQIPLRYMRALDRLHQVSNEWNLTDFSDADRIPIITKIPLRDPQFKYLWKSIRKDGRTHALVRYWPRNTKEPKLVRKTLGIPERMSEAEIARAIDEYNAKRTGVVS